MCLPVNTYTTAFTRSDNEWLPFGETRITHGNDSRHCQKLATFQICTDWVYLTIVGDVPRLGESTREAI
jgi:hypothetical protein